MIIMHINNKPALLLKMFLLVGMLSISSGNDFSTIAAPPALIGGKVDLSDWSLIEHDSYKLRGEWNFYYNKFIDPDSIFTFANQPNGLIAVPGPWDNYIYSNEPIGGFGIGTYHAQLILNAKDVNKNLALRVNSFSTAARIFINGVEIGQAGYLADSRVAMQPEYYPMILDFTVDRPQVDIVIQVSNFYHKQGGFWAMATVGSENKIRQDNNFNLVVNLLIIGSLVIIGLYHMGMYSLRDYTRTPFYFGLFALTIGIRALLTGDIPIHHFFPDFPWWALIRLEYLTVYLGIPLFMKFQQSLFPDDFPRRLARIILVVCLLFAATVILTPPWIFTRTLILFFPISLIASIIYLYASIQSVLRKRIGSRIFLFATVILFASFINDLLVSAEIIFTSYTTTYGFLVFMIAQAFLLSYRFFNTLKTIENQERELRRNKDNLEGTVTARTVELQKVNRRLKALTRIDGLTGIANRRRLDNSLKVEFQRMKRSKKSLAVIMCDIDYFKKYNDNYGHLAGDECLQSVASTMKKCVNRPADLVARYGGEEFCVILPDTELTGAVQIAERIRSSIEKMAVPHGYSTTSEFVTISIGVAVAVPDENQAPKDILEVADSRLYKAKSDGRNRVNSDE